MSYQAARDPAAWLADPALHSRRPMVATAAQAEAAAEHADPSFDPGAEDDSVQAVRNPSTGRGVLIFPLGAERFRTYFMGRKTGSPRRLRGRQHVRDFIAACIETGARAEWFARARVLPQLA